MQSLYIWNSVRGSTLSLDDTIMVRLEPSTTRLLKQIGKEKSLGVATLARQYILKGLSEDPGKDAFILAGQDLIQAKSSLESTFPLLQQLIQARKEVQAEYSGPEGSFAERGDKPLDKEDPA